MVHGVLLINKTSGSTSHGLVHELRKILNQREVGHGGTLDPIAEGLMLILLGQGTKLSQYLLMNNKRYDYTLKLGVTTDTLDRTGKVLAEQPVHCSTEEIRKTIEASQGFLSLPVPVFSAVKIKGRKLYEYGRAGEEIIPPKRQMYFYDLNIKDIDKEKVKVEVSCSKGSYIRSWVSFVGEQLKTGACLENLSRTQSEPFYLKSALKVEEVAERLKNEKSLNVSIMQESLSSAFIPFSEALPHIKAVSNPHQDNKSIRQGRVSEALLLNLKEAQKNTNQTKKDQIVRIMSPNNQEMLALLELRPFKSPRIRRVFLSSLC